MTESGSFYVLRSGTSPTFYVLLCCVQIKPLTTAAGTRDALVPTMGVRRFEDLEAWQLANELKLQVYRLTEDGPVTKDREYCRQIRKSAASSSRNIAEGFGRFRPKPFAQFMEFSIASTHETHDALLDGVHQKHFTQSQIGSALQLVERCLRVSTKFLLYLKRCDEDELPFLKQPNGERRTKNDR